MGVESLRDDRVQAGDRPGAREDGLQHRLGERSRERVLLARVVAGEQDIRPDRRLRSVAEPGLRPRRRMPERREAAQRRIPADGAKRDDHPQVGQQLHLADEVWPARRLLLRRGLVRGWRATDGGRDPRPGQAEAVVGAPADRPVAEALGVERAPQELARLVAREHAPGPVAPVRRRCEADEEDPRIGRPVARDGSRPVRLGAEAGDLQPSLLLAPRHEPRAGEAVGDTRLERGKVVRGRRGCDGVGDGHRVDRIGGAADGPRPSGARQISERRDDRRMDWVRLGLGLRAIRRKRGWTQAEAASRAKVSQSAVSRAERGEVGSLSGATLVRIAQALGARYVPRLLWQGEALDRLLDAAHAGLVEDVIQLLVANGWEVVPEATFSRFGERGSIDILAWHPEHGALLVVEVKSVVPDMQALLAGVDRKVRIARLLAAERGWRVSSVSRLLVLPGDRTARRRLLEHA